MRTERTQIIDLGLNHTAELRFLDEVLMGLELRHPAPDGALCQGGGWVPLQPPGARWTLMSLEPLTLAPSIRCLRCNDHGFIQNGKWVISA